jgi:hypothetical protein
MGEKRGAYRILVGKSERRRPLGRPRRRRKNKFIFNNQPDALINQIYSVIKLYMFRASPLPIIRISLLYIRHW